MNENFEIKNQILVKGAVVSPHDPNNFRKHTCDTWIKWSKYDNRGADTNVELEINHIDLNGKNELANLQSLQWSQK